VFLAQVLDEVFIDADYSVLPTLRKIAPNISGIVEDDVEKAGTISLEFLRMNRPISYLGLPAISVSVGRDRNGIPIGLQIVARPNEDHTLLKFVQHFIRAAGF
jgi:aspartyl-tRNA(Asn)/glutamyl-tRNA(Gln) amidotransferase subunit A